MELCDNARNASRARRLWKTISQSWRETGMLSRSIDLALPFTAARRGPLQIRPIPRVLLPIALPARKRGVNKTLQGTEHTAHSWRPLDIPAQILGGLTTLFPGRKEVGNRRYGAAESQA